MKCWLEILVWGLGIERLVIRRISIISAWTMETVWRHARYSTSDLWLLYDRTCNLFSCFWSWTTRKSYSWDEKLLNIYISALRGIPNKAHLMCYNDIHHSNGPDPFHNKLKYAKNVDLDGSAHWTWRHIRSPPRTFWSAKCMVQWRIGPFSSFANDRLSPFCAGSVKLDGLSRVSTFEWRRLRAVLPPWRRRFQQSRELRSSLSLLGTVGCMEASQMW